MAKFTDRLKHAWDAFQQREPPFQATDLGPSSYSLLPYVRASGYVDSKRAVLAAIWNRIAVDASMIRIEHVRNDENGRYTGTIQSGLNNVLTLEANIDQTGRDFLQDIFMSMFEEGVIAIVPITTTLNPNVTQSYDVLTMRTGRIVAFHPKHVEVEVFDDRTLLKRILPFDKRYVGILQNPFYAIMNEPNSTLRRLNGVLNNIDKLNSRSAAGKLDMIIKLPYLVKGEKRISEANRRRKLLEDQLRGDSEYGIAYIDGTEEIIQLGKPLENNLVKQAEDLMEQLFNQIGMPKAIFDGTATDEQKVSYYNNTISPILYTLAQELTRKFISKTARTQGQAIDYFQDIFKLIPVTRVAEIVDKFTRNEIMSPNEIRTKLGYRPSNDPKSDELRNRNINEKNMGGMIPDQLFQQPLNPDEQGPEGEGEYYEEEYPEEYQEEYPQQ